MLNPGDACNDVGILVHGDNHFIVHGPLPEPEIARALVRTWSTIRIGATTPPELRPWNIVSKAFRENLQWAVVVPGEGPTSSVVAQLLTELAARGIVIRHLSTGIYPAQHFSSSVESEDH